jgi:hypothetical protein
MPPTFIIRTKRTHCLLGFVVGAVFLFLGLDLHFFHFLKGWKIPTDHVLWIIFSLLGGAGMVGSIRRLFWPETFLVADEKGITLFSGGTAKKWNPQTRSWDVTRRKGDPCLIPWQGIRRIGVGCIETGTRTTSTGGSFELAGGRAIVGGRKRQETAKALEVLCDPSLKLSGFDHFGISHAWNGFQEEELAQMPKADRQNLKPEDLCSGFVLHHCHLPGGLDRTIAILEQWWKNGGKT